MTDDMKKAFRELHDAEREIRTLKIQRNGIRYAINQMREEEGLQPIFDWGEALPGVST